MNIYLQTAGLVLLAYLLFLYKSHKTLHLSGKKTFHPILLFTTINLLLGALSVVAIHFRTNLPELLVRISCKAYIVSMIWLGMADFCYVMPDLKKKPKAA